MENASKALYMAAAILIAIMIIGVMVYVFKQGATVGENYDATQNQQQIELFNSKFEYYIQNDNTISDVISLINLANNVNELNDYNQAKSVSVEIEFANNVYISVSPTAPMTDRNYAYIGRHNAINSSSQKIYLYDLLDKNVEDILIYGTNKYFFTNNTTVLTSLTLTGQFVNNDGIKKNRGKIEAGTMLTQIEENSNQRYKYLFDCDTESTSEDAVTYQSNGRLNYIKLKLHINDLYGT